MENISASGLLYNMFFFYFKPELSIEYAYSTQNEQLVHQQHKSSTSNQSAVAAQYPNIDSPPQQQHNQLTYFTSVNTNPFSNNNNQNNNLETAIEENDLIDIFELTQNNQMPSARGGQNSENIAGSFLPASLNSLHQSANNYPSHSNNTTSNTNTNNNSNSILKNRQPYKEMMKRLKKGITVNMDVLVVDAPVIPSAQALRTVKKSQTLLNIKGDRIADQLNGNAANFTGYRQHKTAGETKKATKTKSPFRRERTEYDLEINLGDKMASRLFDSTNHSIKSNVSTPRFHTPVRARILSEKRNTSPELIN
jgi:hypothetical protein